MIEAWVLWTLLAASLQSVRTAGQKALTAEVSAATATLVRYLFGLPFALAYLAVLIERPASLSAVLSTSFLFPASAAAALQILATFLMIRLFMMRSFAIGSAYVRSEILLTAVIGMTFFGDDVSLPAALAIAVSTAGLVMVSIARSGTLSGFWNRSALYGIAAGLAFALTSLFIRSASRSLGFEAVLSAAFTLAYMVSLQTLISLIWVVWKHRDELRTVVRRWRTSLFVGVTSVTGSAGWFTAFTLERAAYVKTLGQIEFLLTLLLSVFYFREKPTRREWAGMALLITGVVMLLMSP